MCLAQGHNAVTSVKLEPAAPRSQVKHSTTEPLRSHERFAYAKMIQYIMLTYQMNDAKIAMHDAKITMHDTKIPMHDAKMIPMHFKALKQKIFEICF